MRLHYLITLIALIGITTDTFGFTSLKIVQAYTAQHPEYPPTDNNFMNPDYTNYYLSLQPNFFTRMLRQLRIIPEPLWRIEQLKELLDDYLHKHSAEHHTEEKHEHVHTDAMDIHIHTKEQMAHVHLEQESRFFIWTDLYGDMHSLTRSLTWLHEHDLIDEHFFIKHPHDYFIFNGNCIDIGPYSLETLTIVLLLLKNNPNNVIYAQGKHEHNNHWIDYGLKRELLIKAAGISNEAIPLHTSISHFFSQLPLMVTLSSKQNLNQYIRIISEVTPNEAFKSKNLPLDTYAIITDENWIKHNRMQYSGLSLISQEEGATTWALLSAPVVPLKTYYNFIYDAFAMLQVPKDIAQTTITLYNHNNTKEEPFVKHETKSIVTGMTVNSKDPILYNKKNDLIIGSTSSLEQGVVVMGQYTKQGLDMCVNQQNIKGGINGHHIRSIIYNDDYTPYLAHMNIQRLISQDHTNIIMLPIGSPTLESYIDYVQTNSILVLFPITGGPQFRKPDLKGIVHFRASYADEIRALIHHMYTEYGARKFAFFYQNDAYGKEPLNAAHEALEKRGIKNWIDIPYSRVSSNFKEQAEKIMLEQPDAIGLLSTTNPTEELIRQVGIDVLANKKLFGVSFLNEESFGQFLKLHGLHILFASAVPNPKTSPLEIVKEYRELMDRNTLNYDVFSLEAYIAATIFIDVASQIKGPLNKDTIRAHLEALHNYQLKGLTLTFNANQRSLAQALWIQTTDNSEWIKVAINN